MKNIDKAPSHNTVHIRRKTISTTQFHKRRATYILFEMYLLFFSIPRIGQCRFVKRRLRIDQRMIPIAQFVDAFTQFTPFSRLFGILVFVLVKKYDLSIKIYITNTLSRHDTYPRLDRNSYEPFRRKFHSHHFGISRFSFPRNMYF